MTEIDSSSISASDLLFPISPELNEQGSRRIRLYHSRYDRIFVYLLLK